MNAVRARLAELMDATVANRDGWHYAQFRPCGSTVTDEQAEHGTVWADCSAGYAILCRLAGAPNPLHAGPFDGIGNTGTAWLHLEHITLEEAQVGDVVIYGWMGDHHIAAVREPGPDPLLWTNGSERAPEYVRYTTEQSWQPHPATWARLMAPDPAPKPAPAVDPYWSWLRWYLGEGEFKGHQRDPLMRPDVPKTIPAAWWTRERKFVAAREQMRP